MQASEPIQSPIDETCDAGVLQALLSLPLPSSDLIEPNSYRRLIIWLRLIAARRDALMLLTNSAVAFYLAANPKPLSMNTLASIFGGGDPSIVPLLIVSGSIPPLNNAFATAYADLSVTGRGAFASFAAHPPDDSTLIPLVVSRLASAGVTVTAQDVAPHVKSALDRAYVVAHALRGPAAERLATRPTLNPPWAAVSAEDDPPDRPVNVPTGPFPQFDIPVMVDEVAVQIRCVVASPDTISPGTPFRPGRRLPVGDPITIPMGPTDRVILFIHGHGSGAEECLGLIGPLQAEGQALGLRITVVAFDLPNSGYSTMFDHTSVAPSAATTYPAGITAGEHVDTPILQFLEDAIVAFVGALDQQAPFTNRCLGIIGGSLGGNMALRLGRREGVYPWLRNGIVAWSPAGVWAPMIRDEVKRQGPDHCLDKWNEPEQDNLPGNSTSRDNYFLETFTGGAFDSHGNNVTEQLSTRLAIAAPLALVGLLLTSPFAIQLLGAAGILAAPAVATMLGPVQATEWYRDDWQPCNAKEIAESIHARQEIYNAFFRQWSFRVAGEQLVYSHVDRVDHWDPNSPWRYELNRRRTLLASGEKDDFMWTHIFPATQTLASDMTHTPGRSLFIADTGHSIHIERPRYFAQQIVHFLAAEHVSSACARPNDFTGDRHANFEIWRPGTGEWWILGQQSQVWGQAGDIPVPGDYDGDRKTDLAIWRPSTGQWWILGQQTRVWGQAGDIPVPGDYDGDGKTDLAIWRPTTGEWWILGQQTKVWGQLGDIPVPGDYDGDGKTDFAIWRPSTGTWWILPSSGGSARTQQWGLEDDIPVPGDYDGDGKTDMAIWRPFTGEWWLIRSSDGSPRIQQWGLVNDIPVPGDYDGDGKCDFAVWRRETGEWWVIHSSDNSQHTQQWGLLGDIPGTAQF